MTSLHNRILVTAALALAAICASAVPASAQAVCAGSFTLPNEVRWQGWTFPAGEYTFRMDSVASPVLRLKGPNGSAFVHADVADQAASGKQGSLTMVHRGSRALVHDMYLAPIGLRLQYHAQRLRKGCSLRVL